MFVVVILLVTGNTILVAGRWRLEEDTQIRHTVARLALEYIVRANQVKSIRGRYVAEVCIGPGCCIVTFEAGGWEAGSCMFAIIIRLMAGKTVLITRWRGLEEHSEIWHAVAGLTLQYIMCAQEVKSIGCRHVAEVCILPCIGVVAFKTHGREAGAGMVIIVFGLVTGYTILITRRWRLKEHGHFGNRVTGRAVGCFMCTEQSKAIR